MAGKLYREWMPFMIFITGLEIAITTVAGNATSFFSLATKIVV